MAGSGAESILPIGDLYLRDVSIRDYTINNASLNEIKAIATRRDTLLEYGSIKAKIHTILPLEDASLTHKLMERSEIWGKIIIKI